MLRQRYKHLAHTTSHTIIIGSFVLFIMLLVIGGGIYGYDSWNSNGADSGYFVAARVGAGVVSMCSVLSVGVFSVGMISIGFVSIGFFSIGFISFGVFGIGVINCVIIGILGYKYIYAMEEIGHDNNISMSNNIDNYNINDDDDDNKPIFNNFNKNNTDIKQLQQLQQLLAQQQPSQQQSHKNNKTNNIKTNTNIVLSDKI